MLTCRWCSLDVIAASWCTEQTRKKSWEFDSIIMENMRHNLLLFCAPTRPSYHMIEYHLHVIFGQVENLTHFPYFTKCWRMIWLTYDTAIWKRENWSVCVPFGESKHGVFVKSLKNLLRSIQQIQIRHFGLPNPLEKRLIGFEIRNRPIRQTQCCAQLKSFGNNTFCSKYFRLI